MENQLPVDSLESLSTPQDNGQSQQLATIVAPARYPLVPLSVPGQKFGRLATCLDTTTRSGRAVLHNCVCAADEDVGGNLDKQLDVVAWVCWDSEGVDDQSGEVNQYTRWGLILADGRVVSGTSEPVLSALRLICATEGPGPWDTPIPVMIIEKRTGKGRTCNLLKRLLT